MADRTPSRPPVSSLSLEDFLAIYPRMAGAEEPPEEETNTEETTTPPADAKPEDALGDAGKRALDAERTARKAAEKAARDAQAKVKEYEDAQKSEADKLTDRATNAEQRLAEANRKLAAIEAGLPASMADRLRGDTPEELKADADALKAQIGTPETKDDGGATPPGSLDGGARTPAPKKSLDEKIVEATQKGDWDAVNTLNAQKLADLVSAA